MLVSQKNRWWRITVSVLLLLLCFSIASFAWIVWRQVRAFNDLTPAHAHLKVTRSAALCRKWISWDYVPFMDRVEWLQINVNRRNSRRLFDDARVLHSKRLVVVVEQWSDDVCKQLSDVDNMDMLQLNDWESGARCIGNMTRLKGLGIRSSKFGDEDLPTLHELRSLESLDLSETSITDEGLATLVPPPGLDVLLLNATAITHRGLEPFTNCKSLIGMMLVGTSVSDESIPVLLRFSKLEYLNVSQTAISQNGLHDLRQQLPSATVIYRDSP